MGNKIITILIKGIKDPYAGVLVLVAYLRGFYYVVYYKLLKKNVHIGLPFKAFTSVRIIGPGSVFIDKGCTVVENVFSGLSIVTLAESANVKIGEQCLLGGLTVRCRNQIEIGKNVMTAISLVQDSWFVESRRMEGKTENTVLFDGPIALGNNVWLGGSSIVLGNTAIGSDSVLAAGSLCQDVTFDNYCLISGNPAVRSLPISRLQQLRKVRNA